MTGTMSSSTAQGDWRSTLGRFGLSAKGILYLALGVLAINFATGQASQQVSERGAIELVASQPLGRWLLGVLTAGLFALMVWEFVRAATGDPVEGSEASDRAKFAVKGVLYAATASTALTVLIANWGGGGTGGGGGGGGSQQATATVMEWPGGPWIVAAIGIGVMIFGLMQINKHGRKAEFMQRLARSQMDDRVETGAKRSGQAGYTARGIVAILVGFFFVVAALQHDPQEAKGLSGALKTLAEQTWGQAVLWAVAVGLFLYGLFTFAEARYRRAT
ncbi:MAG: DUF1206 domain-containing protein [Nitriliruptorales bacterium]|nr:DUF1206 domain-containing protein [Nitriliruptorales bacterium]